MPEAHTRWQKFFAAMVEHGHGRTCDIAAISAQRRPRPKGKAGRKKAAGKKSG